MEELISQQAMEQWEMRAVSLDSEGVSEAYFPLWGRMNAEEYLARSNKARAEALERERGECARQESERAADVAAAPASGTALEGTALEGVAAAAQTCGNEGRVAGEAVGEKAAVVGAAAVQAAEQVVPGAQTMQAQQGEGAATSPPEISQNQTLLQQQVEGEIEPLYKRIASFVYRRGKAAVLTVLGTALGILLMMLVMNQDMTLLGAIEELVSRVREFIQGIVTIGGGQ